MLNYENVDLNFFMKHIISYVFFFFDFDGAEMWAVFLWDSAESVWYVLVGNIMRESADY